MFLSAAQLAAMRATAETTLDQVATIERLQTASDGALGKTRSHAVVAPPVPCRLNVHNETQQLDSPEGARLVNVTRWELKMAVGTDVRQTDRIVVGGERFEVQETDAGRINATLLVPQLRRAK